MWNEDRESHVTRCELRQRWTFQADHEDVEDLENLPTFPATRPSGCDLSS